MSYIKQFFQFLKWKYWDYKHPQPKRVFGITCYVGLPGQGKTLSLVEKLNTLKKEFPKAKIYTNFGYIGQNGQIDKWQQLVDIKNGQDGVIFGLDEVHDIFDRKDWLSMPKSVLSLFSQNRKHAKQFVCTAQSFADIVIDIRRRCHYIIECGNLKNRWIFQRAFNPSEYKEKDGEYTPRKRAWRYSFIATNEIYNSYDTYAVINSIREYEKKGQA